MRHITDSQQFDTDLLEHIFSRSNLHATGKLDPSCSGKLLASLFYEPSTRTRFSFESAMLRLGGQVMSTENAREFSSVSKGETIEDTIKIFGGYADLIILRHYEIGAAKRASAISPVPVINAGDGAGQHPSQALIDVYTLKRRFNTLDGLCIGMVGDLLYGRTVRSLCYLLSKFKNIKLIFVAPDVCQMHDDIKDYLTKKNIVWHEERDLDKVLPVVDGLYVTRVQKERFVDLREFDKAYQAYRITADNIIKMSPHAAILHPLPRVVEISPEVDDDPRALYFEQARNGVLIRKSLIEYSLGII